MGILEFLTAYKDIGVGGLFIALYLTTVRKFYGDLKEHKNELVKMTEKYATNLDQSTMAINRSTTVMENVSRSMEQSRSQTNEVLSFIKGRDEGRNQGRQ